MGLVRRGSEESEFIDQIKLVPLQDVLRRRSVAEVKRTAKEAGERELYIVESLIKDLNSMLAHVASLPYVAGIKDGEHCFSLNKHPGVGKLQVTFVLCPANSSLGPVCVPLTGVAGRAERLGESGRAGVRRSRAQIGEIGAGLGVLNVVANQCDGPTLCRRRDVEAGDRIKQAKLRGKLGVGNRLHSGGDGLAVYGDDSGLCGDQD